MSTLWCSLATDRPLVEVVPFDDRNSLKVLSQDSRRHQPRYAAANDHRPLAEERSFGKNTRLTRGPGAAGRRMATRARARPGTARRDQIIHHRRLTRYDPRLRSRAPPFPVTCPMRHHRIVPLCSRTVDDDRSITAAKSAADGRYTLIRCPPWQQKAYPRARSPHPWGGSEPILTKASQVRREDRKKHLCTQARA